MLPRTVVGKKAKVDAPEHGLKAEDIVRVSYPVIASAAIAACSGWPCVSLAVPCTEFIRNRWLGFRIAVIWLR